MIIKEISPNELAELYALRQNVLRIPLGLNLFDEDLNAEKDWQKFGAFLNNRMIGCVMLTPLKDGAIKLRQMCVYDKLQGQGIGKQLVQHAEIWARENGFTVMELHARYIAQGFYKKLDYVNSGDIFMEVGMEHQKMVKNLK
jgi:predicted GNAT family N-acyltransferase